MPDSSKMILGEILIYLKCLLGKISRRIQGTHLYRKTARSFSPKITISRAEGADLENIQKFFHLEGDNRIAQNNEVTNFVAKKKSKVVGFAQLVRHTEAGPYAGYWLFSLAVQLFYRRKALGEKLTQAVIENAKAEGAKELFLLVFEDNHAAIRLYHKLGFKFAVVTALEEELKKEKKLYNRRRVVMSRSLG